MVRVQAGERRVLLRDGRRTMKFLFRSCRGGAFIATRAVRRHRSGPTSRCCTERYMRMRTHITLEKFSAQAMRDHIERPYVSETHDCFHFWNAIPWSLHFLSVPDGKKTKQKKGQPPRHSGLKISPVTTLRATRSLRSLKQALRLTPPAKFSPFGRRPPFQRAGKLHQYWTCIVAWGAGFIFDADVSHTPGRAHISMLYGTAQEDAGPHHVGKVFCASDAGLHRETVRVRNLRMVPFLECDSIVPYFPPCPDKAESKQRAKRPPRHSGLKISPVTTLRATRSLRSLRQALRLTPPAKFSPFGHRPPFKGAGKLHQCWTYRTCYAGFIFNANVSHTPMQTHIETTALLFMPGEVLCRVQARSLVLMYNLMQERTHIR